MPNIRVEKRSQAERMALAEVLLENIWNEFCNGEIDIEIMQAALHAQRRLDSIVLKLDELVN